MLGVLEEADELRVKAFSGQTMTSVDTIQRATTNVNGSGNYLATYPCKIIFISLPAKSLS